MATNVLILQHHVEGQGRYPFTDYSTMLSDTGVALPNTMFIDANIYTIGGGVQQYISKLTIDENQVSVEISDQTGITCTGSAVNTSTSQAIYLVDSYSRPVGVLLGNSDKSLFYGALTAGTYIFGPGSAEFVGSCVAPQPQLNVTGITLDDGSFTSGEVWLIGRDGVLLEWDDTNKVIKVHIVGDPLFRKRNCEVPATPLARPAALKYLTLITDNLGVLKLKPDVYGNAIITAGSNQSNQNVLRIEHITNGIKLKALGSLT